MNLNHQWPSDWDSLIHRVFNVGRRDQGTPAANMVLESSWQVFKSQQTIFKLCDPTCVYPSDPWISRVESRYYPMSLAGLPWGSVLTYIQYLAQEPRTTTREVSQGRKGHEKQKGIKGWRGDHCPQSYCRTKNCTDTALKGMIGVEEPTARKHSLYRICHTNPRGNHAMWPQCKGLCKNDS